MPWVSPVSPVSPVFPVAPASAASPVTPTYPASDQHPVQGSLPAAEQQGAEAPYAATSHRRFDDVDHWVRVFDDPGRDAWQRPEELIEALQIQPGDSVADIGAGTGYFSGHLAASVGAEGTVYAVEVEPKLVVHLRERVEQEGADQVIPVMGSLDNPRLPPAGLDVVLMVNTYHHIDDRMRYFAGLRSTLRPQGRLVVVDWRKKELPVGPRPDHKLSRQQVLDELSQFGYRLLSAPDFLPYQYVLIFSAKPEGVAR